MNFLEAIEETIRRMEDARDEVKKEEGLDNKAQNLATRHLIIEAFYTLNDILEEQKAAETKTD